jgi:hypothetical protein
MQITEIAQTEHPEIGVTVTEVSQDIIVDNFEDFVKACYQHTAYKKIMNFRTLRNYYNEGLTPIQAVKKYFI